MVYDGHAITLLLGNSFVFQASLEPPTIQTYKIGAASWPNKIEAGVKSLG